MTMHRLRREGHGEEFRKKGDIDGDGEEFREGDWAYSPPCGPHGISVTTHLIISRAFSVDCPKVSCSVH